MDDSRYAGLDGAEGGRARASHADEFSSYSVLLVGELQTDEVGCVKYLKRDAKMI
jgi:hypothetical protein